MFKTIKRLTTVAIVAAALPASNVRAEGTMLIMVPGALESPKAAQSIYDSTRKAVLDIEPGNIVEIFDMKNNVTVLRIEAPNDLIKDHPATAKAFFEAPIARLQGFARGAFEAGKDVTGGAVPHDTNFPQALNQLVDRAGSVDTVVIMSSVRREDQRSPAMDSVDVVPSQGHLQLRSTESVYGVADLKDTLGGMNIYVCIVDDAYVHPRQDAMLREFYALKIVSMGAVLKAWTPNVEECLRQAGQGKSGALPVFERDPAQDRPAFLEITDDGWKVVRYLEGYEPAVVPEQVSGSDLDPLEEMTPGLAAKIWLIDDLPISEGGRRDLIDDVKSGHKTPVVMLVSDFDKADGDVLRIHYDDEYYDVLLTSEPQRVVFMVSHDGTVKISGIFDGLGGGVTALVASEQSEELKISVPVGETRNVPFLK